MYLAALLLSTPVVSLTCTFRILLNKKFSHRTTKTVSFTNNPPSCLGAFLAKNISRRNAKEIAAPLLRCERCERHDDKIYQTYKCATSARAGTDGQPRQNSSNAVRQKKSLKQFCLGDCIDFLISKFYESFPTMFAGMTHSSNCSGVT